MKKLNEPLEMLSAIILMHNANEHINKTTWLDVERIVLDHKKELQDTNIKFE